MPRPAYGTLLWNAPTTRQGGSQENVSTIENRNERTLKGESKKDGLLLELVRR